MIFDCFISHHHDDIKYVEALTSELEKRGLTCWYAPRNIVGRYSKAIVEAINHSKVFLLILNSKSAVSEGVLEELELAHNVSKNSVYAEIQPVLTENLDLDDVKYQEVSLHIRRHQFAKAEHCSDFAEIADIILEKQPQLQKKTRECRKSNYIVQDIEDKRLKQQNELLRSFDLDVYQKVFQRYNLPTILDVGCGTGELLSSMTNELSWEKLIGIDKSSRQIATATAKHPLEKCNYYTLDVEAENFETCLEQIKRENGIDKFDIINISMLLLHLENPQKLLSLLKNSLSSDGTIIIREIDDGLNFAFPDSEHVFERIYKMCEHDDQSGVRDCGRRIYTYLTNAGYSKIVLEKQGLSSVCMTPSQKEALFQLYFPFILHNSKIMMEKTPWNKEYKEDYLWYFSKFDEIHKMFLDYSFVFSLGFMTYTAKP